MNERVRTGHFRQAGNRSLVRRPGFEAGCKQMSGTFFRSITYGISVVVGFALGQVQVLIPIYDCAALIAPLIKV
jgi:hypothetical protein